MSRDGTRRSIVTRGPACAGSPVIDQAQLAESLRRLDAGTRALLDLSLRRAIPDDQVAKVLGVDATSIPPRRARGIAQLADMMEIPGPAELAALLIAIPDLPEEAWGVPAPAPFAGNVSRARRARAFRRVAVAASPLVALGAVMAAVVIASTDHSGGGSGSAGAQHGAAGAGAGAGAAATAAAPEARHGLPPGVKLTLAHPRVSRSARHEAARHHRASRAAGEAVPAVLARQPSEAVAHSEPVVFHPAPVVHSEPRHVTHHQSPAKPHAPTSTPSPAPSPAPVQTPSQPVSTPTTPSSPPVQVNAPQTNVTAPTTIKPPKTTPPQASLSPSDDGDDDSDSDGEGDGGGCSNRGGDSGSSDQQGSYGDHGASHHDSQSNGNSAAHQQSAGKSFSPPGLFRKHHGH